MREIKFRAWDKKDKKWIGKNFLEYLCVCDNVAVLVKYEPNRNGGYSPKSIMQLTNPKIDNLEIVQYTGLKDINDKEIYEGDTVRINNEPDCNVSSVDDITNIGWLKGFIGRNRPVEIVGNIYENPELYRGY